MAKFDESSNFTEALSNFHRLERPSCLGSALHQACFSEFPFLVKRKATWLFAKKIHLDKNDVVRRIRRHPTSSDEYDVVRRIRRRLMITTSSDKFDIVRQIWPCPLLTPSNTKVKKPVISANAVTIIRFIIMTSLSIYGFILLRWTWTKHEYTVQFHIDLSEECQSVLKRKNAWGSSGV